MSSIARPVARSVSRSVLAGQGVDLGYLIRSMFANGEQGFFYDPNDLSTMFQDAAGTVPVTAVGQPVGLMLDKSKGMVLGAELWDDSAVAPTGGSSKISHGVYRIYSSDGSYSAINLPGVLTAGRLYKLTFNIDSIALLGTGITNEGNPASIFNSLGKKTVYFFATGAAASLKRAGGACDIQISNVSVKPVAGNHAYQSTSSMRPRLQRNSTTGAYYLAFDGSDDFLQTNNIDFTSTDKVSLFTGVRNLADTTQIIAELSANTNFNSGSFYLVAGTNGVVGYTSLSRGTFYASEGNAARISPYLAPDTAVISAKHDISGSLSSMRRNGVVGIDGTDAKGTGNFGNYPLYIGRRAGTSLPFNGHLYSLIGVGRITTDSETIAIEKELAKRIGVTLSV